MTAFKPGFLRPAVLAPDRQQAWFSASVAVGLGCLALIGVFWELATGAVRVWYHSPTYTHGFLIIPICAYLVYERRQIFVFISPQPFLPILAFMPVGGAAWLIARAAGILEVQQFIFIGMVQLLIFAVIGWRAYRALLFPCLYLFFLVPSGDYLVPSLQDFTGSFAVKGLEAVGIPVYADGTIIEIPNGTFRVDEACAGLRFLIASIAFGFLFANLTYRSVYKRAIFLVLSVVVPIIANGLRAFGIIILAHLTDNRLAVGADHIVYGWGFFVAVTLFLIWVGLKFRDPPRADVLVGVSALTARPASFAFAVTIAVALAVAAPAYATYLESRPAPPPPWVLIAPAATGVWSLSPTAPVWTPLFTNNDVGLAASYTKDGHRVDLYIAYYAHQKKGHELITYDNQLADGTTWHRIGGGEATPVVDGQLLPVTVTRLRSLSRQRLVWHWYWVDDQFTASRLKAKMLQVKAELVTGRRAAAAIVVSIDPAGSVEDPAEILRDFTKSLGSLRAALAP